MAFYLSLFDQPGDLGEHILEETVFPSREAQNAFLRSSGKSLPGRNLSDLWETAAGELGAPDALPEVLWREEIRAVSESIQLLRGLRERTRDELIGALRRLDSEAVWEIFPRSPLEEALQELRENLRDRGAWSPEARRLWIAQRAHTLTLGDQTLAPLPSPSRQIGMFLEAISQNSNVVLLGLLPRELLPVYLRMLGSDPVVQDHTTGRVVPWGPDGAPDVQLSMFAHEEPSLLAAALSQKNPGVLLSASPLADWREIYPAFQEVGADLCFRTSLGARDCWVGTQIAEASWEEVPAILQEDLSTDDLLWAESFQQESSLLETRPPLREFAERVWSKRLWRGGGTRLLSPGESVLEAPDHLVVWGLDAGRFPRTAEQSIFFSEELLQEFPELRPKDPRPAFASALLAAQSSITLLRHQQTPSSFWQEAMHTWNHSEDEWRGELSSRYSALSAIRSGARSVEIEKRFASGDPDPPSGRSYSVTELESFLRCPLGWFVRYRISPRRPLAPEAEEGLMLHRSLEEAFGGNPEVLEELPPEWQERMAQIFLRYGEEWPAEERFLEVPLEMTVPVDDGEITLRGRADCIDFLEGGLLLLDWKRGSPRIEDSLQAALYPLMAAERFEKEPLGFLFVSLQKGEHHGLLAREIAGINAPRGWKSFSQKATAKALGAIQSIEAGEWKQRGSRCPDWCPHYLLSRTGNRVD